jgi:hypothetical protein
MPTSLDYYAPFDGTAANEADWRKFMSQVLAHGVFRGEANKLSVFGDSSGRQTKVNTGKAWARGHYGDNQSIKTLAHSTNTSGNPRIDRVVARADFVNNRVELDVLTGTPAGSPTAPALTQDVTGATVWEVSLAQVAIANGYSTIAAADVTDDRTFVVPAHGAGGIVGAPAPAAGGLLVPAPTAISTDTVASTVTSTSDVDFTGWTQAAYARGSRRYRLHCFGIILTNAGSPNYSGMRLKIMEGASQLASVTIPASGTVFDLAVIVDAPATGLHTYKLQLRCQTGVAASSVKLLGTASADALATTPFFTLEDLGPV